MRRMSNYALINCNVIDGVSTGIKNGMTILVRDGIIEDIGKTSDIKPAPDYKTVDVGGKYVMSGLINAHVHLLASGKPMKALAAGKTQDRVLKFTKTKLGDALVNSMVKQHALSALNSGVTTMRCVGDISYSDVKLRDSIESGKTAGPRLIVSGPLICPTGGHGQAMGSIADSPWEVRKKARKNIFEQVDLIKICSTGGVLDAKKLGDAGRLEMTLEEITAACEEAHKAGMMVASHTQSKEGVRLALKGGVDTIEHGAPFDDEIIDLFLNNPKSLRGYSCLVPTLIPAIAIGKLDGSLTNMKQVNIDNSEIIYKGMVEGMKLALAYGVKVGLGTDASCPYATHYNTWRELDCVVKFAGLTPEQAIHNATLANAEILGIDSVTGTLEKGKCSDIIVIEKNPLEDISALSKVTMVMAGKTFLEKPYFKPFPEVDAALETIM